MSDNSSIGHTPPDRGSAEHDLLIELVDELTRRYRGGENPSIEEYIEKYPLLADEIRDVFPALLAIERSGLASNPVPAAELVGAMVGRYKLLERIGEGGFGIVYMAEQQHPVRRKVALKVIKPGMDSRQVIARFEAERQALAMMEHPNIAKVLDAGATQSGRPYFVMELVPGVPITEYCDRERLAPRERLELFVQVCQAVQHAHTKGIIHRDLKPTNVLVAVHDGVAVPKVIDFGVAKATGGAEHQLTDKTLFTQFVQMIGTPLYMSPEQAQMGGLDVDTRSDVYSLGVLLYELLTGSTPFDSRRFGTAAVDEVRRIIRDEEPPKPSTRLSTSAMLQAIAANRGLEPARLSALVRGELDWIVMRALEKDRNRRYETVNALAMDVQRYLNDETVQACPPSAAYRFRKFARRNKGALAAVTALLAMLLVMVGGLAASNVIISTERNQKADALKDRERALAEADAQRQRAESNFLKARMAVTSILAKAATGQGEWSQLTPSLRKTFSEETARYYQSLMQESSADPSVRHEIAVGYRSLGFLRDSAAERGEAEKCYRESIAILRSLVDAFPHNAKYQQQLGWSHYVLGQTLRAMSRPAEAVLAYDRAISLYEELVVQMPENAEYPPELAMCYYALVDLQRKRGAPQEVQATLQRGLDLLARVLPSTVPHVRLGLGRSMLLAARFDEAERLFREALIGFERLDAQGVDVAERAAAARDELQRVRTMRNGNSQGTGDHEQPSGSAGPENAVSRPMP